MRELGAGAGDVILYLKDVQLGVFQTTYPDKNGVDRIATQIAPLSISGDGPQDVLASRLAPGAQNPPDLPQAVRDYLLSFDPVAAGNANAVATTNRYKFVKNFAEGNAGVKRTLSWSYTVDSEIVEEVKQIPTDLTTVQMSFATNYQRRGRTLTSSVEAVGPFEVDVYYDHPFGTFAFHTPPPIG